MHATRAAVEEGIVPGGGVALLRSAKGLSKVEGDNDDQRGGAGIVAASSNISDCGLARGTFGTVASSARLPSATQGFYSCLSEYVLS